MRLWWRRDDAKVLQGDLCGILPGVVDPGTIIPEPGLVHRSVDLHGTGPGGATSYWASVPLGCWKTIPPPPWSPMQGGGRDINGSGLSTHRVCRSILDTLVRVYPCFCTRLGVHNVRSDPQSALLHATEIILLSLVCQAVDWAGVVVPVWVKGEDGIVKREHAMNLEWVQAYLDEAGFYERRIRRRYCTSRAI